MAFSTARRTPQNRDLLPGPSASVLVGLFVAKVTVELEAESALRFWPLSVLLASQILSPLDKVLPRR